MGIEPGEREGGEKVFVGCLIEQVFIVIVVEKFLFI